MLSFCFSKNELAPMFFTDGCDYLSLHHGHFLQHEYVRTVAMLGCSLVNLLSEKVRDIESATKG